jgi:CubicO group peptidase (beta-lactamase class C family)
MMTIRQAVRIFIVGLAGLEAYPTFCQTATDFAPVEQAARAEIARLNVPGASIAIVRGGEVVFAKGVGVADVETGEAVRPEMLFRLGSTTKMLTATALVGLAVEGKLDLNAPIGRYISGLPPRLSQVTANQLLSHTAGIHDEAPMYGSHDDAALGNAIRGWTDSWLFTEPGKIFSYANPGYWMAGYLVEVLSGKPYADAMEARVFQPLGMARTTLRPTVAMTYPLAQGHEAAGPAKCVVARPAADNAASWPAGSIFSNTADLARFVIAFLNDGRVGGKPVLDPKTIALMSSPHAAYPDSKNSYGYGLELTEFRGVRTLEHGGSRMGYGSFIRMAPEQRVAVIVQTNRTGMNLPATAEKAMELLLPLGPKAAAKPPAAMPVTAEDLNRHAGVYQNGQQRVEIVAKDSRLFLKRGPTVEALLVKRSGARYSLESGGGPEYVMVAGPGGRTEYLNAGSRSFARVP